MDAKTKRAMRRNAKERELVIDAVYAEEMTQDAGNAELERLDRERVAIGGIATTVRQRG